MIKIEVPGWDTIEINNLIIDYNGTIAEDGTPAKEVKEQFQQLSSLVKIFVITADTHGTVKNKLKDYNCEVIIISGDNQDIKKAQFLEENNCAQSVAIGNGRNDILMIKKAIIGISIIMKEGCYTKTALNSDIIVNSINDALDLFLKTNRLIAGLRNA